MASNKVIGVRQPGIQQIGSLYANQLNGKFSNDDPMLEGFVNSIPQ